MLFVNQVVFLDKSDCVLSGKSLANGSKDQLLSWIDGDSCSRITSVMKKISCATGFAESSDVSLLWFSVRMTVLSAAIRRQFRTSSVHAFTQINISGSFVLDIFTSMPAHPSLLEICISLVGPILILGLTLRSNCPSSKLVDLSASPHVMLNTTGLFLADLVWRNSPIFRISAKSATLQSRFALSSTICLLDWFGSSWRFSSVVVLSLSTCYVVPKEEKLSVQSRDWVTFSETLRERITDVEFLRLSRKISSIFPRSS